MMRAGRLIDERRSSITTLLAFTGALVLGLCPIASASDLTPADSAAAASLYESSGTEMADAASSPSTEGSAPPASAAPAAPAGTGSVPTDPTPTAMTVTLPDSMSAPSYSTRLPVTSSSTTEIPRTMPSQVVDPEHFGSAASTDDVVTYDPQNGMTAAQSHSLDEFISEDDNITPLGMQLHQDRRKLNSGQAVDGLLIVDVLNGTPAAAAGLRANRRRAHDVVEGVIAVGSMFFPPAILAVAAVEQIPFSENYDMIIGVDSVRVTSYVDFQDCMREVKPGEIVYLSIIRDGNRLQVPVQLPRTIRPPVF